MEVRSREKMSLHAALIKALGKTSRRGRRIATVILWARPTLVRDRRRHDRLVAMTEAQFYAWAGELNRHRGGQPKLQGEATDGQLAAFSAARFDVV